MIIVKILVIKFGCQFTIRFSSVCLVSATDVHIKMSSMGGGMSCD